MKLAVYGLGRLGYPLFNVLVRAGYEVWGVDPGLENRPSMLHEPDVRWDKEDLGIGLTSKTPIPSDVSFIVVPTPSLDKGDPAGGFDSAYVETALRHIRNVNKDAESHIAVIVSTLSPGTCDRLAQQFHTLRIVYNPTFIALGNVVQGLTVPDLLLIGGNDVAAKATVDNIWRAVFQKYQGVGHSHDYSPFIHWGSFTEIELIKLSVNAALCTKISLANSLGQLFAAYGVDPKAVEIVGRDPRIGTAYFSPGGPLSGPCLPRDSGALQFAGVKVGVHLPLANATSRVNWMLLDSIHNRVMEHKPGSVGILGLSYKYGVDVDTAAVGPWLYDQMKKEGIACFTYDELMPSDSLEEVLGAEVIVVTQKEYRPLIEGTEAKVVDLWSF